MPVLRGRFWVETAAAMVSLVVLLLTLVASDWVELVFRVDPDHRSGSLEWWIVAVSVAVALIAAALARSEWRRRLAESV